MEYQKSLNGCRVTQELHTTSILPRMELRRVECECGFAVEGDDEDVVTAAQAHARRRHDVPVADSLVLALARPIVVPDKAEEAGT